MDQHLVARAGELDPAGRRARPARRRDRHALPRGEKRLDADRRAFAPGDAIALGPFRVHPIRVAHSILDSVALAIETPAGVLVHSGDFKIDRRAPADQQTDLAALAYLVAGVLFILALRGLSSPESSQAGNRFGMLGMAIAVATTLALTAPGDAMTWAMIAGAARASRGCSAPIASTPVMFSPRR